MSARDPEQFAADLLEAAGAWYPLWRVTPKRVAVASPAAGVEWVTTVPANVTWFVQSVAAQLVTAVAVANRSASLQAVAPDATYLRAAINAVQAASLTWNYWWSKNYGLSFSTAPTQTMGTFPSVPLLAGHTLGSQTVNLQAADQWSAITVTVFEVMQRTDIDTVAYVEALRDGSSLQENFPGLILGLE